MDGKELEVDQEGFQKALNYKPTQTTNAFQLPNVKHQLKRR